MNRLALLPLLFAASTADARKKRGSDVVVAKVPSIEQVVREEGFEPTLSQSDIYRPGSVLVPNSRGGHDKVVADCVGVEPEVSYMSQSSIATSLSAGVSARLTAVRGQVAAGVEKRLSFVDPEQRTIPLAQLTATDACAAGLENAARFTDLTLAVLVYDVLVAQIQNTVCTKADASGSVMLLGEAEAAAYSECVQESDAQVPLGFKGVPLTRVLTVATATSPTTAPALPGPTTGSGGTTGGAFGDVSGIAAQIQQAEELKARLEGELQSCLQAETGEAQQAAKRDWATLGQLRDLATTEAGRDAAETQVQKFLVLYDGKTVTCRNDLGERSETVTPREVADARLFLSSPAPRAASKVDIEWIDLGRFSISKTEVTVGQYRACVEAGSCTAPMRKSASSDCNWGRSHREDHPVNCVDWDQASAFAAWAGGRLPTRAEWTYAATSRGRSWDYPWGDEIATCSRAVMADGGSGCAQHRTWPVCSKPQGNSEQGVCDLVGNVWEWTQAEAGYGRVSRGGGWDSPSAAIRASARHNVPPQYRVTTIGFRIAR